MVVETGVHEENHRPAASHRQTLLYNAVHLRGFELTISVVIGTDCTGSCKSNYHTITTMMVLWKLISGNWPMYLKTKPMDKTYKVDWFCQIQALHLKANLLVGKLSRVYQSINRGLGLWCLTLLSVI